MPIDLLKASVDYVIFGTLGAMSFGMVWLALERWWYLRRIDLSQFSHPEDLQIALTRHLTALSSIAANAPYVGLLGTVLGILITFYDLGQGGILEPASIMLGLALALKATAAGLLIAIPGVAIYNGLVRRTEVLSAEWRRR
ncbi:MAG: TonB-system energizer ExbB [Gammaproteobacteria bacterium]